MGLAGGPVPGVERHEVLDVGGDQRAAGGCGVGEDLVVGEGDERWVGYYGEHVVASGAQLLGNEAREHLIKQQRVAHVLPGEQVALTPPCVLGEILGGVGSGDLRVDLLRVGGPVPDGDAKETHRDAGVVGHEG